MQKDWRNTLSKWMPLVLKNNLNLFSFILLKLRYAWLFLFKNIKKPNKAKCNVDVIIKFKIIPIFVLIY